MIDSFASLDEKLCPYAEYGMPKSPTSGMLSFNFSRLSKAGFQVDACIMALLVNEIDVEQNLANQRMS